MGYVARGFVAVCWVVLGAYWLHAARTTKRTLPTGPRWAGPAMRVGAIVVALTIVELGAATQRLLPLRRMLFLHPRGLTGLSLLVCASGVALAIWARVHIGRNWGMPMSFREGHELVTSGPYAYVRHPIYSGVLLTMLGSALAVGAVWFVAFFVFGAYFVISARTEERHLTAKFPEAYPAYRRRTRMLIPFVL